MAMGGVFLYVFLCLVTALVPVQCLACNNSRETQADSCKHCANTTALCVNDFQVVINSTGSTVEEGNDITLTCVQNFTNMNLTFEWRKDGEKVPNGQNKRELVLKSVLGNDKGTYICCVRSPCGIYQSLPHDVTVNDNNIILLVVCAVSALALIMLMALFMHFKLKREHAAQKERMKQRSENAQSAGPVPRPS